MDRKEQFLNKLLEKASDCKTGKECTEDNFKENECTEGEDCEHDFVKGFAEYLSNKYSKE